MEVTTLKDLFYDDHTAAWAIPVKEGYVWQNTNDLGLLSDIDDAEGDVKVVERIDIGDWLSIAVLENDENYTADELDMGEPTSKEQMVACVKSLFKVDMSEEEKKLADDYYK